MRSLVLTLIPAALGACPGDDASEPGGLHVASAHAGYVCGVLFDVQWRLGGRVRGSTPDALDLGRYPLRADGTFASPAAISCTDAIARRLTALCDACQERPGDCEPAVRDLFRRVPDVCVRCGDDVCSPGERCEPDCAATCGDGTCGARESGLTCPLDCAGACGDALCGADEDPIVCPADCRFAVGDGFCEPGETPTTSPQDCGYATCGDAYCQSYEDAIRCPEDCCWPRVCDASMRPRCRDADALERCEPRGIGGCPELVSEPCAAGCVDAPTGARCGP